MKSKKIKKKTKKDMVEVKENEEKFNIQITSLRNNGFEKLKPSTNPIKEELVSNEKDEV